MNNCYRDTVNACIGGGTGFSGPLRHTERVRRQGMVGGRQAIDPRVSEANGQPFWPSGALTQ
jgi:hypothetical protein